VESEVETAEASAKEADAEHAMAQEQDAQAHKSVEEAEAGLP
jgi:hypothetical protein